MRRKIGFGILALTLGMGVTAAAPLPTKEFGSLKKKAKGALKTGDMTTLAARLADIGQDDSKRAVEFLLDMAKIPDGNVYNAARDAIAKMTSEEAQDAILSKLSKSGSPIVKLLLVDAMGERGDRWAGEALGEAAANGKKPEVQRAAIMAIKRKKLQTGVSGLISLLKRIERKDEDDLNLNLLREALQIITGESFKTAADWENFWEPRKNNFKRPMTGGVKKRDGTARRKRPTFFGSELRSNRLVFVIDTSGSMEAADGGMGGSRGRGGGPGGSGGMPPMGGGPGAGQPPAGGAAGGGSRVRIERAKTQLMAAIEQLPAKCRFTIISYSGVLLVGPGGAPQAPQGMKPNGLLPPKIGNIEWRKTWKPKLMPANDKNKADATKFVKELKATGGTFTLNAVKAAFEIKGADTIIVLSDGMPNEYDFNKKKQLSPEEILADISTLNRIQRRVIDTFGFDEEAGRPNRGRPLPGGFKRGRGGSGPGAPPAGFGGGAGGGAGGGLGKFMQDLAEQNGGKYTQIK